VTKRRWVVNASPLIFLAQIDALPLLNQLADDVFVPFSVVMPNRFQPFPGSNLSGRADRSRTIVLSLCLPSRAMWQVSVEA
jgi:hypothetical protein